jgi:hypothetical protein
MKGARERFLGRGAGRLPRDPLLRWTSIVCRGAELYPIGSIFPARRYAEGFPVEQPYSPDWRS